LRADSGTIRLAGRSIQSLRADQVFQCGLGRTFQNPRPLGSLTVMENLLLVPQRQSGEKFWNSWVRRGRIRREEAAHRERRARSSSSSASPAWPTSLPGFFQEASRNCWNWPGS
jgi:ABC-type branched-subunit amino acid transport system ATPase component